MSYGRQVPISMYRAKGMWHIVAANRLPPSPLNQIGILGKVTPNTITYSPHVPLSFSLVLHFPTQMSTHSPRNRPKLQDCSASAVDEWMEGIGPGRTRLPEADIFPSYVRCLPYGAPCRCGKCFAALRRRIPAGLSCVNCRVGVFMVGPTACPGDARWVQ